MPSSSLTADQTPPGKLPQDMVVLIISRLPTEIIVDIVSRLPIRSLVCFGCVCKSWYALLKNPDFISSIFIQTTSNASTRIPNNYFIFIRGLSPETYHRTLSLVSSTESFDVPTDMDTFLTAHDDFTIIGSCNGLVCLSTMPSSSIIIFWNPLTRVFKDLPVSPIIRPDVYEFKVVLGFGFFNDYKLIRIAHYIDYPYQVEIYSLSTNSWREIKANVGIRIEEDSSKVITKGRFHWAVCHREYRVVKAKEVIVTFDMNSEVFSHIQLPNVTGLNEYYDGSTDRDAKDYLERKRHWCLVVLKGDCLGLITYRKYSDKCNLDIWVMDEYGVADSWTRYFSLDEDTRLRCPLGFKNHGEVTEVLLHQDDEEMDVYDSGTQSLKTGIAHVNPDFCSEVFSYVGTLLPIEGGKTVTEAALQAIVPDPTFI